MADRQKPSTKMATNVKKALSSPNVRAVADPENGDISPIDKKRNKLGYHRTAVACGSFPLRLLTGGYTDILQGIAVDGRFVAFLRPILMLHAVKIVYG